MENTPTYPRTVVLSNPKLEKLLKEKTDFVLEGREMSEQIEVEEKTMNDLDLEIQAIERKVDVKDIDEEAKVITEELNKVLAKMEDVKKRIYDRMRAAVPAELIKKHEDHQKAKEKLESDRNKMGLKIQKWNDKIIPLGQQAMKEFIQNEFEDYDTLRVENGKVIGTIFNHFEDWKTMFFRKKK